MGDARGLQVDDLTVQFGGVVAVDGITLRAPAGQITSLIGPNGAGKTTTFNACTGLLRPTSGQVHIDGTDVTGRHAATPGPARPGPDVPAHGAVRLAHRSGERGARPGGSPLRRPTVDPPHLLLAGREP